jgi:hypothetical protein
VTETEDGRTIGAQLRAWQAQGGDERAVQLQRVIRAWCKTATAHGIPVPRQVEMLAHYGVALGGGGQGPDPSAVVPCGYCGATVPGGHGGLCPNGSLGVDGEPGGPSGGGGGGGAIALLGLPAEERE